MIQDDYVMPFGKYKGEKIANVPANYLLWMYENKKIYGYVKSYIEDNLDVLKFEINKTKKS